MLSSILLILEGTLVGNEICVALVHLTLYKLPDECHLRAATPLAGLFGRVMPVWYVVVFALSIAECYLARDAGPSIRYLLDASTGLFGLSIIFTVLGPAPINSRLARLDPNHPPENWLELRKRWDRLHVIRVAILLIALSLLALGEVIESR
jgi:hypothetical protein